MSVPLEDGVRCVRGETKISRFLNDDPKEWQCFKKQRKYSCAEQPMPWCMWWAKLYPMLFFWRNVAYVLVKMRENGRDRNYWKKSTLKYSHQTYIFPFNSIHSKYFNHFKKHFHKINSFHFFKKGKVFEAYNW